MTKAPSKKHMAKMAKMAKMKFKAIKIDVKDVSMESWKVEFTNLWAAPAILRLGDVRLAELINRDEDLTASVGAETVECNGSALPRWRAAVEILEAAHLRILCAMTRCAESR